MQGFKTIIMLHIPLSLLHVMVSNADFSLIWLETVHVKGVSPSSFFIMWCSLDPVCVWLPAVQLKVTLPVELHSSRTMQNLFEAFWVKFRISIRGCLVMGSKIGRERGQEFNSQVKFSKYKEHTIFWKITFICNKKSRGQRSKYKI